VSVIVLEPFSIASNGTARNSKRRRPAGSGRQRASTREHFSRGFLSRSSVKAAPGGSNDALSRRVLAVSARSARRLDRVPVVKDSSIASASR